MKHTFSLQQLSQSISLLKLFNSLELKNIEFKNDDGDIIIIPEDLIDNWNSKIGFAFIWNNEIFYEDMVLPFVKNISHERESNRERIYNELYESMKEE